MLIHEELFFFIFIEKETEMHTICVRVCRARFLRAIDMLSFALFPTVILQSLLR